MHDDNALLDSWNGFISNFLKTQKDGTMYSCYEPDYIRGGGEIPTQESLAQLSEDEIGIKYELAHSYPKHIDNSLSRYAWIRASYTWYKTAAILNIGDNIIAINIKENNGIWETENHIENIYIGNINKDIKLKNQNLNLI